ncbi:hypothetical protein ANANG_G00072770 [Anguilla anguilla]|uniref:Myozenin 3a n=1 Tax=Anguilla anguilla TaxID=7936 RepID=A0A9D3MR14_ANGAN|nr:hypothetical protein ANANG_G00072770 [Anguilla anguilla]
MQAPYGDLTRQRKQQAMALSNEARGGHLNLGKKISVPRDIMMEELHLPATRGSRMFQERLKRVEMFTLENAANPPNRCPVVNHIQMSQNAQGGKENVRTEMIIQPRKMLVTTLDKTVAKKGSPNVIAPGYSGPLKEMPTEKFNVTAYPRGYCSPWSEALGQRGDLQITLNLPLPETPPQKQYITHYRCFNRAPIPFTRVAEAPRLVPTPRIEPVEVQSEPIQAPQHAGMRPNFNRAPRGWGMNYNPESNEL